MPAAKSDDTLIEKEHRFGVTAALFTTCFAVMGSKCALPSVMHILISGKSGLQIPSQLPQDPKQFMSQTLTLSTMAIAIGKLVLGPVIDAMGGILSLKIMLSLLCLLLIAIGTTNSFPVFAVCLIAVDGIFSSNWPACLNGEMLPSKFILFGTQPLPSAVHQNFKESEWGEKVGMLAGTLLK